MLGPIIGAVGSVLGGLFGGEESSRSKTKARSRTTTRHQVDLKQLVKEARQAGFNPLTVLQAGGLSAYTKTFGSSSSLSKTKGSSETSAPLGAGIASAAGAIGGAIGKTALAQSAANAWQGVGTGAGGLSREADAMDLVNAQVRQLPVSSTFDAKPALAAGGQAGGWLEPTFEKPTVTNPFPKEWGARVDPETPDAAAWEQRYGGSEIAEMIGGAVVAGRDLANGWDQSLETLKKDWENNLPQVKAWGNSLSNLWDPPAIRLFSRPVVTSNPTPAFNTNGGGGW